MGLSDEVRRVLQELDDTGDVAKTLESAAVKGSHHVTSCPVAQYLKKSVGGLCKVEVWPRYVFAYRNGAVLVGEYDLEQYSNIRHFVELFDLGYAENLHSLEAR